MRQARVKAYLRGRSAETPVGEIDLVALKGRRLALIEVKRRKTVDDAAFTVTAKQRRRIVCGAIWACQPPRFRET